MKIQHKIIGASVIAGLFIWTIDAFLDFLFFQEGPFLKVLIFDIHLHHLFIRLVGTGSFIIFGIIIAKVVALRKRAEDALKMSEEKLSTMLKSIGDPISIMDKEQNIIWTNEVAKSIFGENIIGKKCYEIFHQQKEPCKPSPCLALKVFQDGSVHEHDTQVKDMIGEIRYFHSTANVALKDNDGKPQAVIEISRDITEQKRAEHNLKIKDIAIASAINGVAFSDLEGNLTSVNESFLKMWGYEDEREVIGKSVTSFWLEKEKIHKLIETMHSQGSWIGENVGVKKDGSQFNVQISAHMVKNNEGLPIYMMSTFMDITERKKVEEKLVRYRLHLEELVKERTFEIREVNKQLQEKIIDLRKSEKRWRKYFELGLIGIAVTSPEKKWIEVNEQLCRLLGYSRDELMKMTWTDLTYPENLESDIKEFNRMVTGEIDGVNTETRFIRKDGKIINASISTKCLREEDSTINYFVVLIQDITERKQAEDALRESETKYRNLRDNASDAILLTSEEGILLEVNRKAETLWGYTKEELIGMDMHKLHPEGEIERIFKDFKNVFKKGEASTLDTAILRKDGKTIPVEITGSAFEYEGKRVSQAIVRDITERKRMEEELQKIEKIEAIGVLAGGIAHDFNNLLTGIVGNLSLAELFVKKEGNLYETLTAAKTAAKQAGQLTHQLLTFSKGGAPIKEPASISELIQETGRFCLRGSNVRYDFSAPDDLWPVEVDKGQISQVIHNLIINANHAMPEGGTINIRTENVTIGENNVLLLKEGNYIKIFIKDQGIGIPKEYLKKIFDPYFTTKKKGSGLGLATCHSIVNNHGGNIMVESEPGVGTTFIIFLPAIEKEIFIVEHVDEESFPSGEGKILFMDDEQNVINTARRILIQLGYEVETAQDGAEALELYRKAKEEDTPFDAVILDLTVPGGMGGKEAIRKLRKIDPHVKAIVSSGYSNNPIMAEYKEFGFNGVIAKPYEVKKLNKVLYRVINGMDESSLKV